MTSEEHLIKIVKENTAAFEKLNDATSHMEKTITGAIGRMGKKNDGLTNAINRLSEKTAVSNEKMSNSINELTSTTRGLNNVASDIIKSNEKMSASIDGLIETTKEIIEKYDSFSEKMTRIEVHMSHLVGLTGGIFLSIVVGIVLKLIL